MKTAVIRSSWMKGYGYRLDTQPYVGGALQTKLLLEELPNRKDKLHSLTTGHDGGIYNGPQFRRNYVTDPNYGVPFITGGNVQLADLSKLNLLSKKDANSSKLRHLRIERGMTLISCSGTIGKMAYARPEMEGIWSSQDLLKIVPDPERIPPGYLYAFLSSKFGVPLVASGTYGSIIQHLEPENILGIDVPRIDPGKEWAIHELIEEAGQLRSEANEIKREARDCLFELTGLSDEAIEERSNYESGSFISSRRLETRLDARFHCPLHVTVVSLIERSRHGFQTLDSLSSSIIEPLRFKRIPIDKSEFSVGLYGSAGIFSSDPSPSYWIQAPKQVLPYLVLENSLLIPRSGSLNGIIGNPVLPIGDVVGSVVTEDAIRVNFPDSEAAGFAYIALDNQFGIIQLKSRAYGSAIPHLDVNQIGKVIIPKVDKKYYQRIGSLGCLVKLRRDTAIRKEREAISIIEHELTAR